MALLTPEAPVEQVERLEDVVKDKPDNQDHDQGQATAVLEPQQDKSVVPTTHQTHRSPAERDMSETVVVVDSRENPEDKTDTEVNNDPEKDEGEDKRNAVNESEQDKVMDDMKTDMREKMEESVTCSRMTSKDQPQKPPDSCPPLECTAENCEPAPTPECPRRSPPSPPPKPNGAWR